MGSVATIMVRKLAALQIVGTLAAVLLAGCAVGQPPGNGMTQFLREPTTNAGYWLYLPEDYVRQRDRLVTDRRWPLVVTFHGMKPFDNDNRQIRQWQQEADRYGFIVCAPQLRTPDLMYEFPFRRITPGLKRDENCTIAILDHLMTIADIDPGAVLSTSWSSGGYLAHYMANRHPDRFSCVATYQSNFSADILDANRVPEYRDHKIAVFFTQNDFKVCREESKQAAQWYSRHGFDLTFAKFSGRGHERTPSVAASFFARTCGAQARTPSLELARLQVREVPIDLSEAGMLAVSSPAGPGGPMIPPVPGGSAGAKSAPAQTYSPTSDGANAGPLERSPGAAPRNTPVSRPPLPTARPLHTTPVPPASPQKVTPPREAPSAPAQPPASSVRARVSSTIGISPLLISYSAVVPASFRSGAYFLWTDNDTPIANGINGQIYLTEPGEHRLRVLVTTSDGKEYQASQTVTVLEPVTQRSAGR